MRKIWEYLESLTRSENSGSNQYSRLDQVNSSTEPAESAAQAQQPEDYNETASTDPERLQPQRSQEDRYETAASDLDWLRDVEIYRVLHTAFTQEARVVWQEALLKPPPSPGDMAQEYRFEPKQENYCIYPLNLGCKHWAVLVACYQFPSLEANPEAGIRSGYRLFYLNYFNDPLSEEVKKQLGVIFEQAPLQTITVRRPEGEIIQIELDMVFGLLQLIQHLLDSQQDALTHISQIQLPAVTEELRDQVKTILTLPQLPSPRPPIIRTRKLEINVAEWFLHLKPYLHFNDSPGEVDSEKHLFNRVKHEVAGFFVNRHLPLAEMEVAGLKLLNSINQHDSVFENPAWRFMCRIAGIHLHLVRFKESSESKNQICSDEYLITPHAAHKIDDTEESIARVDYNDLRILHFLIYPDKIQCAHPNEVKLHALGAQLEQELDIVTHPDQVPLNWKNCLLLSLLPLIEAATYSIFHFEKVYEFWAIEPNHEEEHALPAALMKMTEFMNSESAQHNSNNHSAALGFSVGALLVLGFCRFTLMFCENWELFELVKTQQTKNAQNQLNEPVWQTVMNLFRRGIHGKARQSMWLGATLFVALAEYNMRYRALRHLTGGQWDPLCYMGAGLSAMQFILAEGYMLSKAFERIPFSEDINHMIKLSCLRIAALNCTLMMSCAGYSSMAFVEFYDSLDYVLPNGGYVGDAQYTNFSVLMSFCASVFLLMFHVSLFNDHFKHMFYQQFRNMLHQIGAQLQQNFCHLNRHSMASFLVFSFVFSLALVEGVSKFFVSYLGGEETYMILFTYQNSHGHMVHPEKTPEWAKVIAGSIGVLQALISFSLMSSHLSHRFHLTHTEHQPNELRESVLAKILKTDSLMCRYKPGDFIRDAWIFLGQSLLHVLTNAALPNSQSEERRAVFANIASAVGFVFFNSILTKINYCGADEKNCFLQPNMIVLIFQCLVVFGVGIATELSARYGFEHANTKVAVQEQLSTLLGASAAGITSILCILYNKQQQPPEDKTHTRNPQSRVSQLMQFWAQGRNIDEQARPHLVQPLLESQVTPST